MTFPRIEGMPESLWLRIVSARHRLLMLDYDGTLAPFRIERDAALPLDGVVSALRAIAADGHTSVAIVSGRPVAELERLLGPLPVALVGEHGWDHRLPDGRMMQHPLDPAVSAALERVVRLSRDEGWEGLLERKRTCVVLHTRGLDPARARSVEERCMVSWAEAARDVPLALERIDGGIELRARGRNKGTAVLTLVSLAPAQTLAVFVGDDVTDEDAFEVVGEWGFGIRVGDDSRPTRAAARLGSPAEVARFLAGWRESNAR